MSSSKHTTT